MTREEYAHNQFVKSGVMEIRPDGTIWRKQTIFFHGKEYRKDNIEPRRAETLNPATKYLRITTKVNNRWLCVQAHRLVFFHFFGEIKDDFVINHKNGIKTDNRPENLESITQSDNVKHMWKVLNKGVKPPRNKHLVGVRHPQAKFTREEVIEIRNEIRSGKSFKVIAEERNVAQSAISSINIGKSYRDVKEDSAVGFPIYASKFHPYKYKHEALKSESMPDYDPVI